MRKRTFLRKGRRHLGMNSTLRTHGAIKLIREIETQRERELGRTIASETPAVFREELYFGRVNKSGWGKIFLGQERGPPSEKEVCREVTVIKSLPLIFRGEGGGTCEKNLAWQRERGEKDQRLEKRNRSGWEKSGARWWNRGKRGEVT